MFEYKTTNVKGPLDLNESVLGKLSCDFDETGTLKKLQAMFDKLVDTHKALGLQLVKYKHMLDRHTTSSITTISAWTEWTFKRPDDSEVNGKSYLKEDKVNG